MLIPVQALPSNKKEIAYNSVMEGIQGSGSMATEAAASHRARGHYQTLHIYATCSVMLIPSNIETRLDRLLQINENINAAFEQQHFGNVNQMMH